MLAMSSGSISPTRCAVASLVTRDGLSHFGRQLREVLRQIEPAIDSGCIVNGEYSFGLFDRHIRRPGRRIPPSARCRPR